MLPQIVRQYGFPGFPVFILPNSKGLGQVIFLVIHAFLFIFTHMQNRKIVYFYVTNQIRLNGYTFTYFVPVRKKIASYNFYLKCYTIVRLAPEFFYELKQIFRRYGYDRNTERHA